jgi:hypothetical protein
MMNRSHLPLSNSTCAATQRPTCAPPSAALKAGRCRLDPSSPRVDRAWFWFRRLPLKCDGTLSNFGFKFNLRHYSKARA